MREALSFLSCIACFSWITEQCSIPLDKKLNADWFDLKLLPELHQSPLVLNFLEIHECTNKSRSKPWFDNTTYTYVTYWETCDNTCENSDIFISTEKMNNISMPTGLIIQLQSYKIAIKNEKLLVPTAMPLIFNPPSSFKDLLSEKKRNVLLFLSPVLIFSFIFSLYIKIAPRILRHKPIHLRPDSPMVTEYNIRMSYMNDRIKIV